MTGMPILVLAVALFIASFLLERVLIFLNERRKRVASERPAPIVTGGGLPRGQAAGYIAEPTIQQVAHVPPADRSE